jgi:ribosomal protein L37E
MVRAEGIDDQAQLNDLIPTAVPEASQSGPTSTPACARCGRSFHRTPVRRMTCATCYAANTQLDHYAWRASVVGSPRRSDGAE